MTIGDLSGFAPPEQSTSGLSGETPLILRGRVVSAPSSFTDALQVAAIANAEQWSVAAAQWTTRDGVLPAANDVCSIVLDDKGDAWVNVAHSNGPAQGKPGESAYQIWLDQGNTGTVNDFLASLVGPQGPKGDKGDTGATGPQGPQGVSFGLPSRIYKSAAQTIPSGAMTVVQFDAVSFDDAAMYSAASHGFIAPVTGRYLISAQVILSASATGTYTEWAMEVLVGGASVMEDANEVATESIVGLSASDIVPVAAGNAIQVAAYASNQSSSVYGSTFSHLAAVRVG